MDNYSIHHESSNYSDDFARNICEMVFKSGKNFPIDNAQLSLILKRHGFDYSDYGFLKCRDFFLSLPDFFEVSYPLPTKMMISLTRKMQAMLSLSAKDNTIDVLGDVSPQPIYNAMQTLTLPQQVHSVQLQQGDMQPPTMQRDSEILYSQEQEKKDNTHQPAPTTGQFMEFPVTQQPQTNYLNGQKLFHVTEQQAYARLSRTLGTFQNSAFQKQRNILQEFFSHSVAEQKQFARMLNKFVYMRDKDVTAANLLLLTHIDNLSSTGWGNVLAFSYVLAMDENRIVESRNGVYMCFDTLITDNYDNPIYFLAERKQFYETDWILKGIATKSSRVLGQIIQDNFQF